MHLILCVIAFINRRHLAFKSSEVQEGHPVTSISHSPSGDKYVVCTTSCQPKVFTREGEDVIMFCRGDMYLRDLSNTKGHTMEVSCASWHPENKNIIMTAGLDGALRIWDLTGEALFGNLINKHVLKIRSATGQNRVGASSCCYTKDGMSPNQPLGAFHDRDCME
jgi:WD repeat-containing protein 70